MGIEQLDHYSIRTPDLARAIRFYEDALGFHSGPRPPFTFPGAWMYTVPEAGESDGRAIVHLIIECAVVEPLEQPSDRFLSVGKHMTQVGLDDSRVHTNLLGCSRGDDLSGVHGHDSVGEAHDQWDVVLDHEQGEVELVLDRPQEAAQGLRLALGDSR